MARKVLSTVADIVGAVSGIWDIVEKIQANIQAARNETERAFNSVADIGTIAKATGLGDRRVQQYQYAFAQGAGLSAKESGGVLQQVATLLGRAKQGDQSALAFVQRYGIASSPEKLAGLSADSFLMQGLAGLAGQTDAAQRTADAALLGGAEAATKLAASVAELNSKLEAWASEAKTVRAVLTSEEVARTGRAVKLQNFQTYDDSVKAQRETLADYSEHGGLDFVDGNSIAVMAERRAQAAADLADAHVALKELAHEAQSGKVAVAQLMIAHQKVVDLPDRIEELSDAINGALMRARIEQRTEDDKGRKRNAQAGDDIGDWGPAGGQLPEPRAFGGPVSAFAPYLVGERGPEIFVPRGPGVIVPNNELGGMTRGGSDGGRPVIVNLNVSPGVPEAVRREVVALTHGLALAA